MTPAADSPSPAVLFVCVKNGGKSQMAAALMRKHAGSSVDVYSAGTQAGSRLNQESKESVERVGASFEGEFPKPLDVDLLRRVDRVIIIGAEAQIDPVDDMRGTIERWETDEPSARGIEGPQRMDLIRDDIDGRIRQLLAELTKQD